MIALLAPDPLWETIPIGLWTIRDHAHRRIPRGLPLRTSAASCASACDAEPVRGAYQRHDRLAIVDVAIERARERDAERNPLDLEDFGALRGGRDRRQLACKI